jgi:hypothetical protein
MFINIIRRIKIFNGIHILPVPDNGTGYFAGLFIKGVVGEFALTAFTKGQHKVRVFKVMVNTG